MSVTKMTLAKEDNNGVEYFYPKTTSDIVEYTEEQSVKDKLDSLDGVEREVIQARIAAHDNEQKSNLKTRIDEDYNNLDTRIDNITQLDINNFAGILGIDKGGTGKSTAYDALFNLAYRTTSEIVDLNNIRDKEHIGVWYFGSANHPTNAPSTTTGYLIVIGESGTLCKQIWFNQGSDNYYEIYTRVYTGSSWRDWVKVADKKDLHDLEEDLLQAINDIKITTNNLDDDFVLPISKGGTNAITAAQALYNLSTHIIDTIDVDLNNLIGKNLNSDNSTGNEYIGCYYFGSEYYPINAPESNATGYLIIMHGSGSMRKHIWITDKIVDSNYYNIYIRTYNGSTWQPWKKIATETDIADMRRIALVGSDEANQTGWHLVAEGTLSGDNSASIIFAVHDTKSYNSGILALDVRCVENTITYKNIGWLTRSGFSLNDFAIQTYSDNSWRLFCNVNQQYYRVIFEVIESSSMASKDLEYTLYSNQTVYANTNTPQTSKDLYIPYGRKSNTTIGAYSVAMGNSNISSKNCSVAIGYNNKASGICSSAIGSGNTSSGDYATAIGYGGTIDENSNYAYTNGYNNNIEYGSNSYAFGYENNIIGENDGINFTADQSYAFGCNNSISNSNNSICIGRNNEIANTAYSVTIGYKNNLTDLNGSSYKYAIGKGLSTLANGSLACGSYNITVPSSHDDAGLFSDDTMFTIGSGRTESDKGNAFRVLRNGNAYANGSYNTSGADYAEFVKEWYDGNPDNEDRVGYMVTIKNGKLHKANEGDYIIGITSGNPSIIGNADEEYYWRYERDRFNRFVIENVEEEQSDIDSDGNDIIRKINVTRRKQSSTYDATLQTSYIPRVRRPEWDYVGMRGIVPCRDDGTCEEGGFCKCGSNGIATKAETRGFDTYYVIERIDEETISVEVR